MRLYHFSERGDIDVFVPRAPLRHPDSEPLVYAMNEWNSPLYLFPRDCPRISTWVTGETTEEHRREFNEKGPARIKSYIDRTTEDFWKNGHVYRYTFDPDGFIDGQDYGVWVSRTTKIPLGVELIDNLPLAAEQHGMSVEVVDSLVDLGHALHDYQSNTWTTTLHVSMVRMALLPGWNHAPSRPIRTDL